MSEDLLAAIVEEINRDLDALMIKAVENMFNTVSLPSSVTYD